MADHGAARVRPISYDPGNPLFPTLPDGLASVHVNRLGVSASLTFREPPEQILDKKSAATTNAVSAWYFDGIWRNPIPIEFENITAPKQRTLTVTNSFRTTKTLTVVDVSAISGLTLISPSLPIDIEPFDSVVLTFEASVTGTPVFDEDILLTVSGEVLPVRTTGRRVVIFNAAPQRPLTERLSWLTDNMIAVDGTEQAFSLRQAPRSLVTIEQRVQDDVKRARLLNQAQAIGFLRTGVQCWWQSRELSQAVADVDTVIQVNTLNMEIEVGGTLSIVSPNYATAIEVEVASFTPTSVTLSQPIGTAFSRRASVMPIRFGFARPQVEQATFPVNVQDVRLTFNLIEYQDIGALNMAYFAVHPVDGLPIVTAPLFFSGQSRRDSITNNISTLDSLTGDVSTVQREPLGRPGVPVLVRIQSQEDQHAWRQFLHYVRGSWRVFYIPTGTNDLPLKDPLELGTNQFVTDNLGSVGLLQNRAPRRDVAIQVGGVTYFRRITLVTELDDSETYTMDSTLPGSGFVAASAVRVSWLQPVRISGDSASFRHNQRNDADLTFSVRGVIL